MKLAKCRICNKSIYISGFEHKAICTKCFKEIQSGKIDTVILYDNKKRK